MIKKMIGPSGPHNHAGDQPFIPLRTRGYYRALKRNEKWSHQNNLTFGEHGKALKKRLQIFRNIQHFFTKYD